MNNDHEWNEEEIRDFVINHIKKSIENDVGVAIRAYWDDWAKPSYAKKKEGKGFFAVPRMIFPELDGLGSYITGRPGASGGNIKQYLIRYMSKIDERYATYAGFIVLIFRHGLLHQHTPKQFTYKNKSIGWQFIINSPNNPIEVQRGYHLIVHSNNLLLDMNVFYLDVLNSIDLAVEDICIKYKTQFNKSIKIQFQKLNKTNELKRAYLKQSDFDFLKSIT